MAFYQLLLPHYFFVRKKEVDLIRVNNVRQIAKLLEIYYDKHANYPLSLNSLVTENIVSVLPVLPQSSGNGNYEYVPLGDNKICTGYHLGIALRTWVNDLSTDADSKASIPCDGASRKDFDGTALNCKADYLGRAEKDDNCFDIKI